MSLEQFSAERQAMPETGIVQQLHILHTPAEEIYDNAVQVAAMLCQAQAAALIFFNGNQGWVKAKTGIDITEIDDFGTLPQHTTYEQSIGALSVTHPLFIQHRISFYISLPLTAANGEVMAYLCVMDAQPLQLSLAQWQGLNLAGRQIVLHLQNRIKLLNDQYAPELQINRAQLSHVFHNAIDAIVVTTADNTIIQWNLKAEKLFGWSRAEIAGRKFDEVCIPQHTATYNQYKAGRTDQINTDTIELTALNKAGKKLEIKLGLSNVVLNQQQYIVAFVGDITEYKEVTSRLDRQKAFYENILNKLPTDIVVFDANHRYMFVNPGAISNEEYRKFIIGKDDYEYAAYRNRDAAIADQRRAQFLEVKNTGREMRWEDSLHNPEGKIITHLRRLFPVHDENGNLDFVLGFGMDITERKTLEEKQSVLVKQLSAQNAQLVDFCNIVSHNLRGPLVNMSMLVQFIKETDDIEEHRFLISKLQPVIDNLHTTFNELVESIQIKQDVEIQSEKIYLEDCVKRTLEGLDPEISKTGAVIETDFQEAATLYYPPKYLFSIFHNLIGNSLKYRSPERKPHIRIGTKRDNGTVILSVSDNGLGLDIQKHKDNLFKIGKVFHRHPNAKGFGLFMTKTQVEAMDGNIWAESVPNEGTTFFVEFKNQHI
ncbi:sensor histidine kinase [Mucilaginibacter koreensis]